MPELAARIHRLLGAPVAGLTRLHGGRNSRVSRADLADGRVVAAKEYFAPAGDDRRRLDVEFAALGFLHGQGVDAAPVPLAREGDDLGLYSFLPGAPAGRTPRPGDAEHLAGFLLRLRGLAPAGRDAGLPPASDACFSLAQAVAAARARLARFDRVADPGFRDLARELDADLDAAEAAGRKRLAAAGLDPDADLDAGLRTLSPSDFGLHNALRTARGLGFVDFEFFGWDDPAKLAADVLLHPGMDLDPAFAARFTDLLAAGLAGDPGFRPRLEAGFPVHGLKWCLILCNEFLAPEAARRAFSSEGANGGGADARPAALARARAMLAALRAGRGLWRPALAA